MIKPLSAAISSILLASMVASSAYANDTVSVGNADASNAAAGVKKQGADRQSAEDQSAKQQDVKKKNAQKKSKATNLGEVVVTGVGTPTAVSQIPGAITVISQKEIKYNMIVTQDATAVLARTVPGYSESTQQLSSGENLRGRTPLRLFDGVPQGSPLRYGARNGTFTDLGVIGRIEVINGASASEGIGAAGGVINYISKVPTKEGDHATVTARYKTQGHSDSANWKTGVVYTRKKDSYDLVLAADYLDRGITYDGDGRSIGLSGAGGLADSTAKNIFLKAGYNFGNAGAQRLQVEYSHFKLDGKGGYVSVLGCRGPKYDGPPAGQSTCGEQRTNTSVKGHIFGSKSVFNDFKQYMASYTNANFFDGTLDIRLYSANQRMRYLPENAPEKQDPLIAPVGTLWEQSEIDSKKKGLRLSWTRGELFNVDGLTLNTGVDLLKDYAQQQLALTHRLWVPPMHYKSVAPYVKLTWDVGPLTFSGGLRRQNDKLSVHSYTSTWANNRVHVQGGSVKYNDNLKSLGAIWRIAGGWSVFYSYSAGFTLPNIGIPLRNINTPGQSVDRIAGLKAIIITSRQYGFNWRGDHGAVELTHYISTSPFGTSLKVSPKTSDFILSRAPTRVVGTELSSSWRFNEQWQVKALYSHEYGRTAFWSASPAGLYPAGKLKEPMGQGNTSPIKIVASVTWNFLPNANVTVDATKLFSRHLTGSDIRPYDGKKFSYEQQTYGYTLYNLGANYILPRNLGTLSLGIENLFNKQYIITDSQIEGWHNFFAGRGRGVSLTYAYSF